LYKASPGSAGYDLVYVGEDTKLEPMEARALETGLYIAMPENMEAQIRSRSGLAINHNITVLNSPGTIDSDYRGEIKVILMNFSKKQYEVKKGTRIAQMIFMTIPNIQLQIVEGELPSTQRGSRGFGSSG